MREPAGEQVVALHEFMIFVSTRYYLQTFYTTARVLECCNPFVSLNARYSPSFSLPSRSSLPPAIPSTIHLHRLTTQPIPLLLWYSFYRPDVLILREGTAVLGRTAGRLPLSPLGAYVAAASLTASRLRLGTPADAGRGPRLICVLSFSATWLASRSSWASAEYGRGRCFTPLIPSDFLCSFLGVSSSGMGAASPSDTFDATVVGTCPGLCQWRVGRA
eukprot:4695970-Pyramimonas_sp.AAC.1